MARPDLYVATINQLRYGAAAEELSEKLAECVDRASSTGKTAELTLVIKIKPQGASGQYFLTDEIKQKLPSLPKEQTIFFGTPEGNLTREDPRQQKLPLVSVALDTSAVKTVEAPAGELKRVV